jgi:hypothetical protein
MEKKRLSNWLYYIYNAIRICIVIFLLFGFLSDIHEMTIDPDTYDKVYTGEFLGRFSYDSLWHLKVALWRNVSFALIYVITLIMHLTMYKRSTLIAWLLLIVDIFVVLYFCYMMCYIRQ